MDSPRYLYCKDGPYDGEIRRDTVGVTEGRLVFGEGRFQTKPYAVYVWTDERVQTSEGEQATVFLYDPELSRSQEHRS